MFCRTTVPARGRSLPQGRSSHERCSPLYRRLAGRLPPGSSRRPDPCADPVPPAADQQQGGGGPGGDRLRLRQLPVAGGQGPAARRPPGHAGKVRRPFCSQRQARGGRQDLAHDALSPAAQARHRFKAGPVESLDADAAEWRQVAIADRRASVPDIAAFRIDFAAWLRTLTRRDRRIIAALAAGEGTSRVAGRFGLSAGRVSQLRRRYAHLWRSFQGEIAA